MSCTKKHRTRVRPHRKRVYCTQRKEAEQMNMATLIAVIVIAAMLFFAGRYIYKEKKKGTACIGCPYADSCQKKQHMKDCCK